MHASARAEWEVILISEERLGVLEYNYGPYKKYSHYFVDYPDVNYLIDSIPMLIGELRALKKVYDAGKEVIMFVNPMFCDTDECLVNLRSALSAYEKPEAPAGVAE